MEIQQLRYVLAAAEHRSFTNAATAVHVTQPNALPCRREARVGT